MLFNIDVHVVINDDHHFREKGAGHSSKSSTIVM